MSTTRPSGARSDEHTQKAKLARRAALGEAFTLLQTGLAKEMGHFVPGRGSLAHPDPRDVVAGDTTYTRSLFKAARGDIQWDPVSNTFEQIRHDPDGQSCWHPDTDDWARGIGWFDWQVRVPGSENERVTLWFSEVAKGRGGEGAVGVDGLKELRRHITEGWHHYAHDMAWRGVHCDAGYALDLMPFVKVTRDRDGAPKSGLVDLITTHLPGGVTETRKVFALDGIAGIEGMVNGKDYFVALRQVSPRRDPKNPTAHGVIRYYGEYRIPAHPALPAYLHGQQVRLRLDGYRGDVNVSDCLRFHNEHVQSFSQIYGIRNDTESDNNRFKQSLHNKRAHSVGIDRQWLEMLGYFLLGNLKASVAHMRRTGRELAQFGGGSIGPPGATLMAA